MEKSKQRTETKYQKKRPHKKRRFLWYLLGFIILAFITLNMIGAFVYKHKNTNFDDRYFFRTS